jgi:hypothetical protein
MQSGQQQQHKQGDQSHRKQWLWFLAVVAAQALALQPL